MIEEIKIKAADWYIASSYPKEGIYVVREITESNSKTELAPQLIIYFNGIVFGLAPAEHSYISSIERILQKDSGELDKCKMECNNYVSTIKGLKTTNEALKVQISRKESYIIEWEKKYNSLKSIPKEGVVSERFMLDVLKIAVRAKSSEPTEITEPW